MNPVQTEEQSIKIKKMESLYQKHIILGKEAQAKGDRLLSESYYQHAEHYLQVMNELKSCLPIPASIKKSTSAIIKGVIKDHKLERTSLNHDSDTQPKPQKLQHNDMKKKLQIAPDDILQSHFPGVCNEQIKGPRKYYLRRFASRKEQNIQVHLTPHDKEEIVSALDSLSLIKSQLKVVT